MEDSPLISACVLSKVFPFRLFSFLSLCLCLSRLFRPSRSLVFGTALKPLMGTDHGLEASCSSIGLSTSLIHDVLPRSRLGSTFTSRRSMVHHLRCRNSSRVAWAPAPRSRKLAACHGEMQVVPVPVERCWGASRLLGMLIIMKEPRVQKANTGKACTVGSGTSMSSGNCHRASGT